jgi:dihydropteroate synthase
MNAGGKLIDLSSPKVMGILNITPDSFYDGGRHNTVDAALLQAEKLLTAGADLLDLGAYSSRPGAAEVGVDEEKARLLPVIAAITTRFPESLLSIDTFRADVARASVEAGAHIINDISGGTLDEQMFATIAELQVPYILMHMRGTPNTMQRLTDYEDVVQDVNLFFGGQLARLRQMKVTDIILDPGFGFAKTLQQNYDLLNRLEELHIHGLPILGAVSRKSMIYKKLGITPEEALNGTTVLHTLLLTKGIKILRVHDVKEAKEVIALLK